MTASAVLDREEEGEQEDPAADRGVEDRAPDALGGTVGGVVRLLGEVRRGVEAGDRVLGEQEAEREHVEPEARAAGLTAGQAAAVVDPLVNTSLMLMCFSGRKMRMAMMIAAPTTCHHTEMLLSMRQEVPAEDVDQRGEHEHDEEHPEDAL